MRRLRIGAGAGFSGDRIEPAVALAEQGQLDYLVFECLAERTIALAQQAKRLDPRRGYDPLLERRMRAVLPACRAQGVRIVSNMGAANPLAAAEKTLEVARALGLRGLRVAAVLGDDLLEALRGGDHRLEELDAPLAALGARVISANAYLGAGPIVAALAAGADVVLTGRAADAALFLAPQVHAFGWAFDDWTRLGRGTAVGHLLECAGQITGGYFADPGFKEVPDLARLGFPLAEITEEGEAVITKLPGSGGLVTEATCKEQLLYEIQDPARYLQPDVVADFSGIELTQAGPDRVTVRGARGHPRSGLLKVSVGYLDSYLGEGQISYAGPGALERGRLALEIVAERLRLTGVETSETRGELIGVDAILGSGPGPGAAPREVRLRFVGRTADLEAAQRIGDEVEALYLNGPAGGGGVTRTARELVAIASTLVPEGLARPSLRLLES